MIPPLGIVGDGFCDGGAGVGPGAAPPSPRPGTAATTVGPASRGDPVVTLGPPPVSTETRPSEAAPVLSPPTADPPPVEANGDDPPGPEGSSVALPGAGAASEGGPPLRPPWPGADTTRANAIAAAANPLIAATTRYRAWCCTDAGRGTTTSASSPGAGGPLADEPTCRTSGADAVGEQDMFAWRADSAHVLHPRNLGPSLVRLRPCGRRRAVGVKLTREEHLFEIGNCIADVDLVGHRPPPAPRSNSSSCVVAVCAAALRCGPLLP